MAGFVNIAQLGEAIKPLIDRLRRLETQETPTPPSPFDTDRLVFEICPATTSVALTAAPQDVPGASITLDPGTYLVMGVFTYQAPFTGVATDDGQIVIGYLNVAGSNQGEQAQGFIRYLDGAQVTINSISQMWKITVAVSTTIKLQVAKSGGTGNSISYGAYTRMIAWGLKNA